jgi:polyisoprenoid-binding protein YceI
MRLLKLGLVAIVAAAVLVVAGTFVYIQFIRDDPPPKLTLEADTSATVPSGDGTIDGTWSAASEGTQVGYRVNEVLFGQKAEAVGRTSDVTGSLTIEGTTVTTAEVEADMTTVESDENRRDNQFQGRIMETSRFPTATFTLNDPIELESEPAAGQVVTKTATGKLTLHGTTKEITVELSAQWDGGDTIKVQGEIPITFDDYGIPNPSFGGITTEDHGSLELLVVFTKG